MMWSTSADYMTTNSIYPESPIIQVNIYQPIKCSYCATRPDKDEWRNGKCPNCGAPKDEEVYDG